MLRPVLVPSTPCHTFTIDQLDLLQPLSDPDLIKGTSLYDTRTVSTELHKHPTNTQCTPAPCPATVPVTGAPALGKQAAGHPPAISHTTKARAIELQFFDDHLGKLVLDLSTCLRATASWESFVDQVQGPSYLAEDIHAIPHHACTYLQTLHDNGATVNMDDPPWTAEQILGTRSVYELRVT